MEETKQIMIRRNVINLYHYDTLDEIIKEMINYDLFYFETKYKVQIDDLQKTRFLLKGVIDEEILKVLKNIHDGPGDKQGMYIRIFEQEFFPLKDDYLKIFQDRFLLNLDFHFNIKRTYSIDEINDEINNKINELYTTAIESFTNQSILEYKNKYLPLALTLDGEYIHIERKENKLEILEKIGVVHKNNNAKIKTVFVKYIFDMSNNYFEIAYNENSVRDLCLLKDEDKIITLTASGQDDLKNNFERDSVLLGHLYSRVKRNFVKNISIESIDLDITAFELFRTVVSSRLSFQSQFDLIEESISGKESSPYEAVLYKYFYEDKEKIISNVMDNIPSENNKIEDLINNNFSKELNTEELNASIRFLRNMTVFSKIKQNQLLVEKLDDYLFMFTVRDLAVTKSTTRNEERQPIYTSDFYWHLQEVIDAIQLINELGLRKTVRISDGTKIFQDVKVLISGGFITFTYFQHTRKKSFKKNPKDVFKLAEGRNQIHDDIKAKFREIISRESSS